VGKTNHFLVLNVNISKTVGYMCQVLTGSNATVLHHMKEHNFSCTQGLIACNYTAY